MGRVLFIPLVSLAALSLIACLSALIFSHLDETLVRQVMLRTSPVPKGGKVVGNSRRYMTVEMPGPDYGKRTLVWCGKRLEIPAMFLIATGAFPVVAYATIMARIQTRTRWRRKNNLCLRCGYDLRASPERCPECGRVV